MRTMMTLCGLVLLTLAQAESPSSATAQAAADPAPGFAALSLGAGSDFPISIGLHARSELGPRLQLGMSLGVLPRPYLDVINDTLVRFGAYDEETAALISAALNNAVVWRTHLGFRPFRSSGFFVTGGYTWIGLGGDLTGSQALYALTGIDSDSEQLSNLQLDATAMAHQAGLELGWRWRLGNFLSVEAAAGGFYTFAASSDLSFEDDPPLSPLLEPVLSAGERYLEDTLRRHVHGGYVSLRGYVDVL